MKVTLTALALRGALGARAAAVLLAILLLSMTSAGRAQPKASGICASRRALSIHTSPPARRPGVKSNLTPKAAVDPGRHKVARIPTRHRRHSRPRCRCHSHHPSRGSPHHRKLDHPAPSKMARRTDGAGRIGFHLWQATRALVPITGQRIAVFRRPDLQYVSTVNRSGVDDGMSCGTAKARGS